MSFEAALFGPDDQNTFAYDIEDQEIAGIWELFFATRAKPLSEKDALFLPAENFFRPVVGAGQRFLQ
jgi:hypothetical protein